MAELPAVLPNQPSHAQPGRGWRDRMLTGTALAATLCAGAALTGITPAHADAYASNKIVVGTTPVGVAFSPDGAQAYVINSGNDTVSVIEASTATVTRTIPVGSAPEEVAFSPDGAQAYVTNTEGDSVSVIEVSTAAVTATISVGTTPVGVAFSPDGAQVYVANSGADSVSVIGVSTGTAGTPIPVGSAPVGLAFSPDGAQVYVANSGADSVSVIGVSTAAVTATILVGSAPVGVAFSPDGEKAYVTNTRAGSVSVIKVATGAVTRTFQVGSSPVGVVLSPHGTQAYVADAGSDSVSVLTMLVSMVVAPSSSSVQAGTAVTLVAEGYTSGMQDSSSDVGAVTPVYTTDPGGTVSGNTVTFHRSGRHTITATLAGVTATAIVTVTAPQVTLDGPATVSPPYDAAFVLTGTAPAGATVTLHFHKPGMPAADYSIVRTVTARADGTWSRTITASSDYRYYATVPGATSTSVLLQAAATLDGAVSRTVPLNRRYTLTGTAVPGSTVFLHFHQRGTAADDYSVVRSVTADAAGRWQRSYWASTDYRVYASRDAGTDSADCVHYLLLARS